MKDFTTRSIRSSAILTTSYVSGTAIDTGGNYNQMIIIADFTIGSLTSVELKVEFSNDGTTYYQETNGSVSGSKITETLAEHSITASGKYRIAIPLLDRFIKISVKGTGTVTSSLMTVDINLGLI